MNGGDYPEENYIVGFDAFPGGPNNYTIYVDIRQIEGSMNCHFVLYDNQGNEIAYDYIVEPGNSHGENDGCYFGDRYYPWIDGFDPITAEINGNTTSINFITEL